MNEVQGTLITKKILIVSLLSGKNTKESTLAKGVDSFHNDDHQAKEADATDLRRAG